MDLHINLDQSVQSEPRLRLQLAENLLRDIQSVINRLEVCAASQMYTHCHSANQILIFTHCGSCQPISNRLVIHSVTLLRDLPLSDEESISCLAITYSTSQVKSVWVGLFVFVLPWL